MDRTFVLKTSWPGADWWLSKVDMFVDCNAQFGVMPHVCSYDVTNEHGTVISDVLFFPKQDQIVSHFWDIFTKTPPKMLDVSTYKHTILSTAEGPLMQVENPHQLSCAWADSLLGALL